MITNTAVFPRSIPGGGKSSLSTLLKKLCEENGLTCSIHSTDSKFYNDKGEYFFEPNKVNYFHRLNYDEFVASTAKGTNLVILDNTNIVLSYFNYYVKNCQDTGYNMVDVVFHPDSIQKHFERNVHAVPFANIERMARKFDTTLQFGQSARYEVFSDTWKMNVEDVAKKIVVGILGN
jgi:tRNA uridine 5-carbamoylmethylation protein Kti12